MKNVEMKASKIFLEQSYEFFSCLFNEFPGLLTEDEDEDDEDVVDFLCQNISQELCQSFADLHAKDLASID